VKVFQNRLLRRIFGPMRDEVAGVWRELDNEELRNLHSSRNIIRMVKSWGMIQAGRVARMEKKIIYLKTVQYRFLLYLLL
jgi:hypothetical protein